MLVYQRVVAEFMSWTKYPACRVILPPSAPGPKPGKAPPWDVGQKPTSFRDLKSSKIPWWANKYLAGGWATPLKNMKVSWDVYSQYMENMFQTTNQIRYIIIYILYIWKMWEIWNRRERKSESVFLWKCHRQPWYTVQIMPKAEIDVSAQEAGLDPLGLHQKCQPKILVFSTVNQTISMFFGIT